MNATDEYQLQVPESEVEFYRFPSGLEDRKMVETIFKDVEKSKKKKKNGEEYKSATSMLDEYGITMNQLKQIIKAENDASSLEVEGRLLSGNVKVDEDGNFVRAYTRSGELMVRCIEDAYKDELGFSVPITGAFLYGKSWYDAH